MSKGFHEFSFLSGEFGYVIKTDSGVLNIVLFIIPDRFDFVKKSVSILLPIAREVYCRLPVTFAPHHLNDCPRNGKG